MMNLVIGLVVFVFATGIIDGFQSAYKQSDEYRDIMDNYYADVRRLENI